MATNKQKADSMPDMTDILSHAILGQPAKKCGENAPCLNVDKSPNKCRRCKTASQKEVVVIEKAKYHYKTIVSIAQQKGYSIKTLAEAIHTTAATLSKQLKRQNGSDLPIQTCRQLQKLLAPRHSLEMLFREAGDNL